MRRKKITQKNITPQIKCTVAWRLKKVVALDDFTLEVTFNDKTHGFVDMNKLIFSDNAGVFAALRDPQLFEKVYLALGVVTWPGEIDLAPDAMYDAVRACGRWVCQ